MRPPPATFRSRDRVEVTRKRLIQAAEKIFARDGFEAARLEDIAAEAGYTRGAFYANFDSKEDLFLALLEREISARIGTVESRMARLRDPDAKLRALRQVFINLWQDRRWSLLSMEFKLFAVRHPEAKARLAAMNRRFAASRVGVLKEVMEASGRKLPASAGAVARSLSVVANALALEHMLDRAVMSEGDLRNILATYFDGLTGVSHAAEGETTGNGSSLRKRRINVRSSIH